MGCVGKRAREEGAAGAAARGEGASGRPAERRTEDTNAVGGTRTHQKEKRIGAGGRLTREERKKLRLGAQNFRGNLAPDVALFGSANKLGVEWTTVGAGFFFSFPIN